MIRYGEVRPKQGIDNVIVVGSGESLSNFNFSLIHGLDKTYVICVNDSYKGVPFADAWFTLDPWGLHGPQLPNRFFKGKLFAAVPHDYGYPNAVVSSHRVVPTADITFLERRMGYGLSDSPRVILTGNSGFGAFNMAYLMKPKKILLLGIDGTQKYFYNSDRTSGTLFHLPKLFSTSMGQILKSGIRVINGSPSSKVTAFTRYSPEYAVEELMR